MTFLHPWAIWVGVFAAGLPVLIHLLARPNPVRLPLSTIRFVRKVIQQRQKRHRLRDFIILALRTLAVLLLALAIARPQFGEQSPITQRSAETGNAVRVVILDVSQSMAAVERGITTIERARTAAAGYLRYRPGLKANLILAAATSRPAFAQCSSNFDALREELDDCRALPQGLDVRRALELAAGMLAPYAADDLRRFELVVVSDFQRTNWTMADFSVLPEKTEIQLESVAAALPPANLAILKVDCSTQSLADRTVRLDVTVGNFSPGPRQVTVEATIGRKTWRLEGHCPGGARSVLTEEISLDRSGWLAGQVKLLGVDDALAADNTRPLAVHVCPKPVYALVTRQPPTMRPSSSHFLECGLVPDSRRKEAAAARLVRVDPATIDRRTLGPASLVALDHPGKLSAEAIGLLAGLMRRGRPILYVAAEPSDATNLKRLAQAAGTELQMPVEFAPAPSGRPKRARTLTSVRGDDLPFSVFGDNLTAIVGKLRFAGGVSSRRLQGTLDDDLLAVYGDGTACMTLTSCGAGSLAVINADLAASNLARTPVFVPLLDELVGRMLRRNGNRQPAYCGQSLVAHLPIEIESSLQLSLVAPDDYASTHATGQLTDETSGVVWRWTYPDRPGVFRVQRGEATVFSLAVEVPPTESELESLSAEVLKTRLAGGRKLYYRQTTGDARQPDDSWTWFLTASVLCMLCCIGVMLGFRV